MNPSNFRKSLIFFIFLIILLFPILNSQTVWIKDIASTENRAMPKKPKFNLGQIDSFPHKFESYYSDNFNLRSLLVKGFNFVQLTTFKKTPVPEKVVLGNDGWLFFVGNEHDSYKGKRPLTDQELKTFKKELEYRKAYLEKRGCKFYFAIAPIKANIYPEKVPNHEFRAEKPSWGEQLIKYLNQHSSIQAINLYSILRSKKGKEPLYYKLDNHWNQLGAFYAANEILQQIHTDFPRVNPNNLCNYHILKKDTTGGNLVEMLSNIWDAKECFFEIKPKAGFRANDVDKEAYPIVKGFPYPNEYELDKEIKDADAPKVLIISDSFGGNLFPFLAENFSRSVKIFDAWQYKLNEKIVDAEDPDVVILICLESGMRNMLKYYSFENKL